MWNQIVGQSFTTEKFDQYVRSLVWLSWRPSFIVLHNTFSPNLNDRPDGITQSQIQNFVTYYRDKLKWSGGPHLFIDDRQIWAFTPMTEKGTHSPSWNNVSIGIEMLGNYDTDSFSEGRGLAVHNNAVAAIASISGVLEFLPSTLKLHKEDPKTTHKDCPGKNVDKGVLISEIEAAILSLHPGEHSGAGIIGAGLST